MSYNISLKGSSPSLPRFNNGANNAPQLNTPIKSDNAYTGSIPEGNWYYELDATKHSIVNCTNHLLVCNKVVSQCYNQIASYGIPNNEADFHALQSATGWLHHYQRELGQVQYQLDQLNRYHKFCLTMIANLEANAKAAASSSDEVEEEVSSESEAISNETKPNEEVPKDDTEPTPSDEPSASDFNEAPKPLPISFAEIARKNLLKASLDDTFDQLEEEEEKLAQTIHFVEIAPENINEARPSSKDKTGLSRIFSERKDTRSRDERIESFSRNHAYNRMVLFDFTSQFLEKNLETLKEKGVKPYLVRHAVKARAYYLKGDQVKSRWGYERAHISITPALPVNLEGENNTIYDIAADVLFQGNKTTLKNVLNVCNWCPGEINHVDTLMEEVIREDALFALTKVLQKTEAGKSTQKIAGLYLSFLKKLEGSIGSPYLAVQFGKKYGNHHSSSTLKTIKSKGHPETYEAVVRGMIQGVESFIRNFKKN